MIETYILFGILIVRILMDVFALAFTVARAYLHGFQGTKFLSVFWAASLFFDVLLMHVFIVVTVILEF